MRLAAGSDPETTAGRLTDGFVTIIDATKNQVVKKFDNLGAGLEQARYNPTDKMMYMNRGGEGNEIFQLWSFPLPEK